MQNFTCPFFYVSFVLVLDILGVWLVLMVAGLSSAFFQKIYSRSTKTRTPISSRLQHFHYFFLPYNRKERMYTRY
jgi:hypothetical protein